MPRARASAKEVAFLPLTKALQRFRNHPAMLPLVQKYADSYGKESSWTGQPLGWSTGEFYGRQFGVGHHVQVVGHGDTAPPGFQDDGLLLVRCSWDKEKIRQKLRARIPWKSKTHADHYLDYIERYRMYALRDMLNTKVPASISLAQGVLESGAGRSRLAVAARNHFGIKARAAASARKKIRHKQHANLRDEHFLVVPPATAVFRYLDDNIYDRFEMYDNVDDSYRRHAQLLVDTGGRYSWIWYRYTVGSYHDITEAALEYESLSGIAPRAFYGGATIVPYYAACAAGLKMSGYATNSRYHKLLSYIVDTYELWLFDFDLINAVIPCDYLP